MKNVLNYQTSNYDCGPTCVTNAIRFLFEREEIPPVILKEIWTMGVDTYADGGEPGKAGTSKAAMRYMSAWFECYAEKCGFPLKATFLDSDFAAIRPGSLVWGALEQGGCAVVRVWHYGTGHYVLLTQLLSEDTVGLFDPYDGDPDEHRPGIRFIEGEPRRKNREVSVDVINGADDSHYAMGPLDRREVLLFWRKDS